MLRAEDGKLLSKRKLPNVDYHYQRSFGGGTLPAGANLPPLGDVCLAKLGRNLLTWRRDDAADQNLARLDFFDPWTQRALWPTRKFAAAARSRCWDGKQWA